MKILTTTSDRSKHGHQMLTCSLEKHGYDFEVIEHPWRGFVGKILHTYEWLKAHPEVDRFLYTDAWDTMALAGPKELEKNMKGHKEWHKILFSAEKACYPHPEKAERYPKNHQGCPWRYLNGGGWMGRNAVFCKMVEEHMPAVNDHHLNDQAYFTDRLLEGYIVLDYYCNIFQTIGFEAPDDFTYELDRLKNNYWGTRPIFAHGNGHTPMNKIWQML